VYEYENCFRTSKCATLKFTILILFLFEFVFFYHIHSPVCRQMTIISKKSGPPRMRINLPNNSLRCVECRRIIADKCAIKDSRIVCISRRQIWFHARRSRSRNVRINLFRRTSLHPPRGYSAVALALTTTVAIINYSQDRLGKSSLVRG